MHGDSGSTVVYAFRKLLGLVSLVLEGEQYAIVLDESPVRRVCQPKSCSARLAGGRQLDAISGEPSAHELDARALRDFVFVENSE